VATLVFLWSAVAPAGQTPAATPSDACARPSPDRIVAVGDVHGAYEPFVALLREAGIVDRNRRWAGGRAALVQLGDVLDRGPDSKKVLDLLKSLETEAARAGGAVHALVGNHEVMRLVGDLRYISAKEYSAFVSPDARDLRDGLYASASTSARDQARAAGEKFDEGAFRKAFYADTPLGLVEMHRAFLPTGEYGRWLRSKSILARIDGTIFVHGGFTPVVAAAGCAAIDARARAELQAAELGDPTGPDLLGRPEGPLWYRGLVDGTATDADVDAVLDSLGVRQVVVAHTVTPDNKIQRLAGGRVVAIDTGMLGGEFYPNGVASALEIKDGVLTAVYIGRREVLGPARTHVRPSFAVRGFPARPGRGPARCR